jgi:hypothetical protein
MRSRVMPLFELLLELVLDDWLPACATVEMNAAAMIPLMSKRISILLDAAFFSNMLTEPAMNDALQHC